eukprot:TRINITY_DN2096_c0_g1_i5.p1 TRINITY_DN2096_c0_g1~~TRINITY_DN2096_c0_g1_i5.p1  ORF type:complete len:328 (-),score=91.40 TRINITY_DN2096_c0_g1_i5:53-1036(-)
MIEDVMKAYLKKSQRALHAWKIEEHTTLVPVKFSTDEPLVLNSKSCYLLSKYSKGESFDSAHTVCKLKFWVWIGCQCPSYRDLFSPILQYCRELRLPQVSVEVFAEFQFNESADFLFWFNTNLGTSANPYYHSVIHYSFTEKESAGEYFLILNTVEDALTNRHFTSVSRVPNCTKTTFPECSYVWVAYKEDAVDMKALLGSVAPEGHEMIVDSIIKIAQKKKGNKKVIVEKKNGPDSKWNEQFDKGGYDYLIENFWNEEEESADQHNDFADITVQRKEEKKDAEEEDKGNFTAYRIYFEVYSDSIKGRLEKEQKKLCLLYTSPSPRD